MASVTYDHVTKRFDETVAVRDLTVEIADGEFLVLVGPSGCGKTTALRTLAGVEPLSEGQILIGDRVVNHMAPAERDVAMVFQSYALYPQMTVYDNMAFGLRNQKLPKPEIAVRVRRVAEILDLVPLLKRKPKQLSGGQRQRVALGRAIVREPKAFLMDEPLSNLDANLRVATRAEILKLQQRLRTTTVYVTHDQVEAMTMGDRIAVMRAGVLQQTGTPEQLYTRPQNVFVAGFIGSPAMNLIRVGPATRDGRAVLRRDGFEAEVPERVLSRVRTGGEVIAGLRPEHFRVAREQRSKEELRVRAVVDIVEYLGDELLVHARAGDVPLVAKLPIDRRPQAGREVCFSLPVAKLHLFDATTEDAVDLAGG